MEQKIIISGYDGTIIVNNDSEAVISVVSQALLGHYEYTQLKELTIDYGRELFSRYIEFDNLAQYKAKTMWKDFKKTKFYSDVTSNIDESMKSEMEKIIFNAENIPVTKVNEYFILKILFPLIACYNIYILKIRPEETFLQFYSRSKEDGDILLLNSFKHQMLIEEELRMFARLNFEKYKVFEDMINSSFVFGATKKSCKEDKDRVRFLLEKAKNKCVKNLDGIRIIVMGSNLSDAENFDEAFKINPSARFLFVDNKMFELQRSFWNKVCKLKCLERRYETLDETHNKYLISLQMPDALNNLKRINSQLKKVFGILRQSSLNRSGNYRELCAVIYR